MSDDLLPESEWLRCAAMIRARWPHNDLPDSTIMVWREAVRDLPREQVEAAIEVFYRDGRDHAPNGGQLRQKVAELSVDAPQWGEVWPLLRRAQRKAPALAVDPDERVPYLRSQGHDLIADFIETIGWPEPDEWSDDNLESRLRRKWEEWLRDRLNGKVREGIAPAGLSRLERGDGPRKLPAGNVLDAIADSRGLPRPSNGGGSPSGSARYGLTVIDGGKGTGGMGPTL